MLRVLQSDNTVIVVSMIAAFLAINYLHFHLFEVYVVFYACVVDLFIACAFVLIAHFALRRSRWSTHRTELTLAATIGVLLILLYSVLGPTVIDRSLSMYILQNVHHRGGAVAEAAIPRMFVDEYMHDYRLVDVRLTEHLRSRTMILDSGCVRLTAQGEALAVAVEFYREHFLPRRRVLRGEITDQLTRPLSDAPRTVEATCPLPER